MTQNFINLKFQWWWNTDFSIADFLLFNATFNVIFNVLMLLNTFFCYFFMEYEIGTGHYCMESVPIRSFSGPYLPEFGPNVAQKNSEYRHFSCAACWIIFTIWSMERLQHIVFFLPQIGFPLTDALLTSNNF